MTGRGETGPSGLVKPLTETGDPRKPVARALRAIQGHSTHNDHEKSGSIPVRYDREMEKWINAPHAILHGTKVQSLWKISGMA